MLIFPAVFEYRKMKKDEKDKLWKWRIFWLWLGVNVTWLGGIFFCSHMRCVCEGEIDFSP